MSTVTLKLESSAKNQPSGVWFALILSLAAGFFAIWFNRTFYANHAPFFDSLSYYDQMHEVMSATRSGGWAAGFDALLKNQTTVCLPHLMGMALSWVMPPCREIGIGIQVLELFLFLWTFDLALRRLYQADLVVRRTLSLSFFTLACLYFKNGGLVDFRMDLSLMLLYGISSLWLLIALTDRRYASFAWLGLAMGATCLFRATAPAYFAFAFGPVIAHDLIWRQTSAADRKRSLIGLSIAAALTALSAGWYFFLKFDFLYYYYFVWNTDANARLPWSLAVDHVNLAKRAIGTTGLLFFSLLIGLGFLAWRRSLTARSSRDGSARFRFDGRFAWIALAPVLLMILMRAGRNPFVAMPSAIGLFLLVAAWACRWLPELPKPQARLLWTCLMLVLALCLFRLGRRDNFSAFASMDSHRQIIETILSDVKEQGRNLARYDTLLMTELCSNSLWSVLQYDTPGSKTQPAMMRVEGVDFYPAKIFPLAAQSEWERLPGSNESEKIDGLLAAAEIHVDYLIVAEAETAEQIQFDHNRPAVNLRLPQLRAAVTGSERWTKIFEDIETMPGRRYAIYRINPDWSKINRVASNTEASNTDATDAGNEKQQADNARQ
jgi:hypothetical protein